MYSHIRRRSRSGPWTAVALGLWVVPQVAWGIDVEVTGDWSPTIDASYLQSGVGSDLVSSVDSVSDQGTIDIINTSGSGDSWSIEISKTDGVWDSDVRIWVRRTGDGSGAGSISGGTSFQEVTLTQSAFFSGAGDRTGVDIQVRISGLSLSDVPSGTYDSSITYIVVDT